MSNILDLLQMRLNLKFYFNKSGFQKCLSLTLAIMRNSVITGTEASVSKKIP